MAFLNPTILVIGSMLAAIPVLLHLTMRRKPKPYLFPALRFVQQRHQANQHRLKVRHWLLLLLRCLAIFVLAAALARPSVDETIWARWLIASGLSIFCLILFILAIASWTAGKSRVMATTLSALALLLLPAIGLSLASALEPSANRTMGTPEAPIAAAIVLDTSPRMTYRHENRSRIESAQEMAVWLMTQFPADSQIAVAQSRPEPFVFSADRTAAVKRVEGFEVTFVPRPLDHVIQSAVELLLNGQPENLTEKQAVLRKELYVLTDLTEDAWDSVKDESLQKLFADHPDIQLYVIDVGVDQPYNFSLADLRLSNQQVARGNEIRIETELNHVGNGGERIVELYLEEPGAGQPVIVDGKQENPPSRRAGKQLCQFSADGTQTIHFTPRSLGPGIHHGWITLSGEDGLKVDDQRFFTIEVTDVAPVLIATGKGAYPHFLTEALAPLEFRKTGRAPFDCHVVSVDQLPESKLDHYAAICLLDPPPLTLSVWEMLEDYVQRGGALAILLGRNARPVDSFNQMAESLLPGQLKPLVMRRPDGNLHLSPDTPPHPLLARFGQFQTSIPWHDFPIYKHWRFEELTSDATVIMRTNGGEPAMVERRPGQGIVLTFVTPISDAANTRERKPWNSLPTGFEPWPFVALTSEMVHYLISRGERSLNYWCGETATLRQYTANSNDHYLLLTPQGGWENLRSTDQQVTVRFTEFPGHYRMIAKNGILRQGFSVNLPVIASNLLRIEPARLNEILGKGRFRLTHNRHEIVRQQGQSRVGQEFHPHLLVLLAMLLGLENIVSNRFYRKRPVAA